MIYSVWDADNQVYKYFEVGEAHNDDGPTPSPRGGGPLGYSPEEISWKLPASARPVGHGKEAKGAVVHPMTANNGGIGLGGLFDESSSKLVGGLLIAGFLWYAFKKS